MRLRGFPLLALGLAAVLLASPELRAEDPPEEAGSASDADSRQIAEKAGPASGKNSKNDLDPKRKSKLDAGSAAARKSEKDADMIQKLKRKLKYADELGGANPLEKRNKLGAVPAAAVDLPPEAVAPPGSSPSRPLSESSLSEDDTDIAVGDAQEDISAFHQDLWRREDAGEFENAPGPSSELLERVRARMQPGQSLDPTRPENPAALALSAEMGFREAFRRHGLKSRLRPNGAPVILRNDGTPATKSELAALRTDILREPKALMRHPNLFSIVPRKDFASVKKALAPGAGSAPKNLKDMTLSQDARDVLWDRTCSSVSGDCNPHAERKSYAKSEYVRPKTLASAAKASARAKFDREAIIAKTNKKLGRKFGAAKGRGIVSRLKSLIGTLKRKFGFQDAGASSPSAARRGGASGGGGGAVYAASAGAGTPRPSPGVVGEASPGRSLSEYRAPAAPGSRAGGRPAKARRFWPWAAAVCLLLILVPLLRRRRED